VIELARIISMVVKMDDGAQVEYGPGDAVYMPPGHDAWIVGRSHLAGARQSRLRRRATICAGKWPACERTVGRSHIRISDQSQPAEPIVGRNAGQPSLRDRHRWVRCDSIAETKRRPRLSRRLSGFMTKLISFRLGQAVVNTKPSQTGPAFIRLLESLARSLT